MLQIALKKQKKTNRQSIMKIIKLNSKPDKDGYFPIPKNMINWRMFHYPYPIPKNKWEKNVNKKVNVIVCYYGEKFNGKDWSIGMMGYDYMIIWDDNNKEVSCCYSKIMYESGQSIYVLENIGDWYIYNKIRLVLQRKEKINKILNHE